jgi:hypothetical protein
MSENGTVVGCVGGTAAYSDVVFFKVQGTTTDYDVLRLPGRYAL